uniref:Uncharacterized protein n=1 Tax=Rhizophora mucronata TaxID=61149 RepID=A0A2P2NBL3_RHIMU
MQILCLWLMFSIRSMGYHIQALIFDIKQLSYVTVTIFLPFSPDGNNTCLPSF